MVVIVRLNPPVTSFTVKISSSAIWGEYQIQLSPIGIKSRDNWSEIIALSKFESGFRETIVMSLYKFEY